MNALLRSKPLLSLSLAVLLAACGGGGGGGSSTSTAGTTGTTSGTTTTDNTVQQNPGTSQTGQTTTDTTTVPFTSYWRMDNYLYPNGGYSHQQLADWTHQTGRVATFSTATLGEDQEPDNGAFLGSALIATLSSIEAGTYTITADQVAVGAAAVGSRLMSLSNTVGIGHSAGNSTRYDATGGTVEVTVDADGKVHLTSNGTLPMKKTLNVGTGVAGAPEEMQLSLHNVH